MPLYRVVIFETVFASWLVVYMLPFLSIAIQNGFVSVVPRMVDVPFGVIFVSLYAKKLAV